MPTDTTAESVDYFWAVWKRRWAVALFTLATLLGSYVVGKLLPKTYSAQTLVLIGPPHTDHTDGHELGMDPLTMDAYHRIAESPALLEKIILNLDLKEENGNKMHVESLREIIFIGGPKNEIHSAEKGQSATGIITINAVGEDPKQITAITNSWADILTKESRNIRSHEASLIHEKILENYNLARAKMKKLETDLKATKSNAQMSLLQQELSNRKARLAVNQIKYRTIDMRLKERKIIHSTSQYQKRKKIKASDNELMKKEKAAIVKIIKTKDSADIKWDALNYLYEKYTQTESTQLEEMRSALAEKMDSVAFTSIIISPSKKSQIQFPFRIDSSNIPPASTKEPAPESQVIKASVSVPEEHVNEKIKELYEITIRNEEVELVKLENTYLRNTALIEQLSWDLSVQVGLLARLANKAEEARMLVSEKTTDIRFVAEAIEPHFPVGPDVFKIVTLGTIIGFFLSIFLCIFNEFVVVTEIREKNRTIDA